MTRLRLTIAFTIALILGFISLLLFTTTAYKKTPAYKSKRLTILTILFGLVAGLSLTHHHTIIIFLIPLGSYFIYTSIRRKITIKTILGALAAFVIGLTPYIFVYLKISSNTQGTPTETLSKFLEFILRFDYGTFSGADLTHKTSIQETLTIYSKRLLSYSLYIFLFPLLPGLRFVLKKKHLNVLFLTAVIVQMFIFFRLDETQTIPNYSRANVVNAMFLSQLNWHAVYLFQQGKLTTPGKIYDELIPLIDKVPNPNYKLIGEIYKNAGSIYLRKSLKLDPNQDQAETIKLVIKTYGG